MVAVNYLWNPLNDNIVREFDDAVATIAEYTTEPEEFGNVVSQRRDTTERYFHFDGVGSTLALTDSAGAQSDTYAYTAYGELTEESGDTANRFQYVGRKGYYVENLPHEYTVRARVLSSPEARWLSADPLGVSLAAQNRFRFVEGRPTIALDPSGLMLYGNYCGQSSWPLPPKDPVDSCCLIHDRCYGACGVSGPWGVIGPNPCARCCDAAFCACLLAAPCLWWPFSDFGCASFRFWAAALFCHNARRPL